MNAPMQTGYATGFANAGEEYKLDEALVQKLAEEAEFEKLRQHALKEIEQPNQDPTQQQFVQRLDTKKLVQSEEEFARCVSQGVPMKQVGFTGALHVIAEAEAAHRNKIAKKHARKRARASRKANR